METTTFHVAGKNNKYKYRTNISRCLFTKLLFYVQKKIKTIVGRTSGFGAAIAVGTKYIFLSTLNTLSYCHRLVNPIWQAAFKLTHLQFIPDTGSVLHLRADRQTDPARTQSYNLLLPDPPLQKRTKTRHNLTKNPKNPSMQLNTVNQWFYYR